MKKRLTPAARSWLQTVTGRNARTVTVLSITPHTATVHWHRHTWTLGRGCLE